MIWFTSDHHFSHGAIRGYVNRPFDTVEEMDEEMIARWNETVAIEDTVYYVGDFCLGDYEQWQYYRNRLNGKILFVPSDHDRKWVREAALFRVDLPLYILSPLYELHIDKHTTITLCHWMMRSWPKSHFNMWHIHGHHHRRTHLEFPGKVLNVCVDLHDFYPWSLDEVVAYMEQQPNNEDFIGDQRR